MSSLFYRRVIDIIKRIPKGKVSTYGQIAKFAGNKTAARQVSFILHSSSKKENLPWHRVVNGKGGISINSEDCYNLQICLLKKEGIIFNENNLINLKIYLWVPENVYDIFD
mgnify:CR=1 FL=1